MLQSTGCFRLVNCPFDVRGSCHRLYCHFKHEGKLAETVVRVQDAPASTPLNPLEKKCDQPVLPEAAYTALELEKVSKAIEVVKTEVEQQQHKLLMYESTLKCQHYNSQAPTSSTISHTSSIINVKNTLAPTMANSAFECEGQVIHLNSVTCNPVVVPNRSLNAHRPNSLTEVTELNAIQEIPTTSSKVKNGSSVLNKYMIDCRRPCTDLEYDPLVNYSSKTKQTLKKDYIEEKQEFKITEQSPEMKFSLATQTIKSTQLFEEEISSDDELVIDVPELPPLPQNPLAYRSCETKGSDANASTLSLIRKVRKPRVVESTGGLDLGRLDNSFARNCTAENSNEKEANVGTLQREKCCDLNENSKVSNVTGDQIDMVGKHHDVSKHGSKVNVVEGLLKTDLVEGNFVPLMNANRPKLSNQKCRSLYEAAKLEVNVQKYENEEQSLINLNRLKRTSDKAPLVESNVAAIKLEQYVSSSAIECNRAETTNKSKCISKLETRLTPDQQRPKMQSQDYHFGNEKQVESLQMTSDRDEESSLSDEDLSSSVSEELDFSESDPMEECLRIFNESAKQETGERKMDVEQNTLEKPFENIPDTGVAGSASAKQKKRIAHVAKFNKGKSSFNKIIIPQAVPLPKQSSRNRIKMVQQEAVQLMANVKSAQVYKAAVSKPSGQKRLIAKGSKPQSASSAKAVSQNSFRKRPSSHSSPSCNVSLKEQIAQDHTSKTTRTLSPLESASRVPAPQRASSKRGAKVSNTVRKQYLGFFIEEFLKTCSSRQAAVKKAMSEEKVIFERSANKFMYLNVAVHALKILKNLAKQGPMSSDGCQPSKRKRLSSGTILEGAALYSALKSYVLTEGQLKENGYPRYDPENPGTALLFNGEANKYIADSLIQVCCRCGRRFSVTPDGSYISKEECSHHWGRTIRRQVSGGWDARYSCCGGSLGSVGCQLAKLHVYNQKENLNGFVKTSLKLLPLDGNPGVYAVNSELCYTKQGGALSHVSVISANLEVVYDVFVKPDNEVIDFNTRFSGVTREDVMNAKTTRSDVHSALLTMFSADTILIGHSLDKDLLALKLIHSMVIDLSVVFPHSLGLPHKRALRNLMAEYLSHTIPDNVKGSDKASACMELMMWRVKEDAKSRKW
ncbi:RNA exonuclease 1 homolog isoform X2 [Chiloscyllium plagiosum]|uniref:RNA exonuclease 1 homolog isoform X2 n=1 Tax=Chiloscyllium plagiosum TaxID=36176 RepID=UPI001CB87BBD|nr:RNA exonuclease 1 homolog isoform X2 [Chiloscyllium plagiosum]